MYLHRIPKIARRLLPSGLWEMEVDEMQPAIYITFDDGPLPEITSFVLEELKKYEAQATFFCLGENVEKFPDVYKRIIAEGHSVGNHTYNHPKIKEVSSEQYLANVYKAEESIESNLFRPPYGRLNKKIGNQLIKEGFQIVYWSYLTGDFDLKLNEKECLEKLIFEAEPGDIIVFHDNEKSFPRMRYVLPRFLNYAQKKSWAMKSLDFKKRIK